MEPVNFDAKRKEKAPKCEFCGNPVHEFEAQCPRVIAVTFEADGGITYHLLGIESDPDLPLAG